MKSHSEVLGVRNSTYKIQGAGEDTAQPIKIGLRKPKAFTKASFSQDISS